MQKIVTIVLAAALAGCAAPNNGGVHSERAIQELLQDRDQIPGSSHAIAPQSYKPDPNELAKTYEDIKRRSDASASDSAPQAKPLPKAPSKWGAGWEQYGDWYVKALHDEMDTVTSVRLFTPFRYIPKYPGSDLPGQDDFNLGFHIFGGQLVTLSPSAGFMGQGYWPHCDYDLSSVSVDGAKAVRLTPVADPGSCNNVEKNGVAITQFKKGQEARVRMGYMNGVISLKGFAEAWSRALALGK